MSHLYPTGNERQAFPISCPWWQKATRRLVTRRQKGRSSKAPSFVSFTQQISKDVLTYTRCLYTIAIVAIEDKDGAILAFWISSHQGCARTGMKTTKTFKQETQFGGQTVQSLERGLDALEMSFADGVKPSDVAAVIGIDRSSAYRLLYTLSKKGYLYQDDQSHKFFPQLNKFLALANKLSNTSQWPEVGLKRLPHLRDTTEETANLGVLDGQYISYVGQELAHDSVIIVNLAGKTRPANCSALGKAILAFLPEEQFDQWVKNFNLIRLTARSIVDAESFINHLAEVRRQGFALDDEETIDGIRCLAAPVLDYLGYPVGAIGISGPISRFTFNRLPDLAQKVVAAARDVSRQQGHLRDNGSTEAASQEPK